MGVRVLEVEINDLNRWKVLIPLLKFLICTTGQSPLHDQIASVKMVGLATNTDLVLKSDILFILDNLWH